MKIVIMSGCAGSGKSSYAKELYSWHLLPCVIVSADNYFIQDGEYKFDSTKLGEAHKDCMKKFLAACNKEIDLIIVDNTNCSSTELAGYYAVGEALGYEVEIITFRCETDDDVKMCAGRNAHQVPFNVVMSQHKRLCNRNLPPWYKNTDIKVVRS